MAPEGWSVRTLSEITSQVSERAGTADIPVLSVTNTTGFVRSEEYFDRQVYSKDTSNYKIVRNGQFAYNPSRINVGSLALLETFDAGLLSPMYVVFRSHADVDPAYLLNWLRSSLGRQQIESSTQGSVRDSVNYAALGAFEIALPPLPEQRQIAAILGSVDETIQATQAVIEQTRTVKQGLLRELLSRGIGHTRFKQTEIGEVPEGWEVRPLSALGTADAPVLRTGPFGSSLKSEHFTSAGRPVLTIQSLGSGEILHDGLFFTTEEKAQELRDYEVQPGDLVFSRVADVGRSVVIPHESAGWIISSNLMRITVDRSGVDPHYLMYQLTEGPRIVQQLGSVVANGGRQIVSSPVVKALKFPVPSIDEQERIVERVLAVDEQLRAEDHVVQQLGSLKAGLMQDLLTGRVRVGGG